MPCRCAETVDAGLPHAAGIINHAAQVGFSTLVSVQVRVAVARSACFTVWLQVCRSARRTQRRNLWISTLIGTAVHESSVSGILAELPE